MKSAIFQINTKTEKKIEYNLEQNKSVNTKNETHNKETVINANIITSKKPRKLVENIYYFN